MYPSKRTVSVFLNNSLTYYHKAFVERRVLNTAILWMAMSRKHVTNRKWRPRSTAFSSHVNGAISNRLTSALNESFIVSVGLKESILILWCLTNIHGTYITSFHEENQNLRESLWLKLLPQFLSHPNENLLHMVLM